MKTNFAAHMAEGTTRAATRYPAVTIVLVLVVTVLSGFWSARHLGINTDNLDMISAEAPFRQANTAFRDAFPWYGDQIAVVIDAPTPEQAEQSARFVAAAMTARPEIFEHVSAPALDPYLRRNGLMFMETERLQDLLDRLASAQGLLATLAERPDLTGLLDMLGLAVTQADPEGAEAAQLTELVDTLARMASNDPDAPAMLSWRRKLTVEGQRGLTGRQIVIAKPVQNYASLSPAKAAIAELRAIIDTAPKGISYRITGNAALNTEELESVKLGGSTAGVISGVGILLLLIIGLRGIRPVLATLAVLVSGLIISLGFATVAVGQLNLLSVAFAVLFIGLAVDFSIHFSLRAREAGQGRDASVTAAGSVGPSLALSALAAAIGFLAFLPTVYRGLAELGLIAAGSMIIALALNLTLLPALLSLAARSGTTVPAPAGPVPPRSRRMAVPVLVMSGLIGLAGLVLTLDVRFDFDPLNLKDPKAESVAAFRDLAVGGDVYAIDALAGSAAEADGLARRLSDLPEVDRVLYLPRFVPKDQPEKIAALENATLFLFPVLSAAPAEAPGPQARETAVASFGTTLQSAPDSPLHDAGARLYRALTAMNADALRTFEQRATGLLPPWLEDLRLAFEATATTAADIPESLRSFWVSDDGRHRLQVSPAFPIRSNADMQRFADAVRTVTLNATGVPITVTAAGEAVVDSFRQATIIAAVLILMLITLMLRSLSAVLLTALPVFLAAVTTLGSAVLFGISLNFANVIVLPLLLGLGVASAIHLVMRRRASGSGDGLMRSSTPRAVLFSSLTTLASFGGLALSPHLGMASMGQLLTIAILSILFFTLLFLPALIACIESARARK